MKRFAILAATLGAVCATVAATSVAAGTLPTLTLALTKNTVTVGGAKVSGAVNIGTGQECDVVTLARVLAESVGASTQVKHAPPAAGEQRRSVVDPSLARTVLGWTPAIALEEGLRSTARWFMAEAAQGR